MGVDMVEIDIRKTKDNQLVVVHDKTLNRTTTGNGLVSEWTLDSLKTVYLKNGVGHPTRYKTPTLKEALLTAKGKILVNLDKSYNYFDEVYGVLKETGTTNQVGAKLDYIIFMPVINLDKQSNANEIIENYQTKLKPLAFELVFRKTLLKY
jgi:glycerophosphoryl diester phosphodiesterase